MNENTFAQHFDVIGWQVRDGIEVRPAHTTHLRGAVLGFLGVIEVA